MRSGKEGSERSALGGSDQHLPRPSGQRTAASVQAHSVVVDDHLLMLTSVNKEDIQLKRIPLRILA
ncbi:MAG: hypothetical protein JJT96_04695 [Opitutales bacterium]|nr:hypothetical protein [Opitutales bacterium]